MRTEDIQTFCLNLLQAARQWRRLADLVARPYGLSESLALPLLLIGRRGGLKQSELADAVGVEPASLVRTIDQLCAAGLVVRVGDGADRRVKRLNLTATGLALADRLAADLDLLRRSVFGQIANADLAAAERVFARLSSLQGAGVGEGFTAGPGVLEAVAP